MASRYKATIATPFGPRRCFQVSVEQAGRNRLLRPPTGRGCWWWPPTAMPRRALALRAVVAELRRGGSTELVTLQPGDDTAVAAMLPGAQGRLGEDFAAYSAAMRCGPGSGRPMCIGTGPG